MYLHVHITSGCMYMYMHDPADIRKLYYQAGVENKPTVFLFTDTQVVEETFLEDINNILSSGEVPNLYKPDEFEEVHLYCICNYTSLVVTHLQVPTPLKPVRIFRSQLH